MDQDVLSGSCPSENEGGSSPAAGCSYDYNVAEADLSTAERSSVAAESTLYPTVGGSSTGQGSLPQRERMNLSATIKKCLELDQPLDMGPNRVSEELRDQMYREHINASIMKQKYYKKRIDLLERYGRRRPRPRSPRPDLIPFQRSVNVVLNSRRD